MKQTLKGKRGIHLPTGAVCQVIREYDHLGWRTGNFLASKIETPSRYHGWKVTNIYIDEFQPYVGK